MDSQSIKTIRRYDIDWLRVIAIGLLLIYHISIGFQPWGRMIGFITSKEPWAALWVPMSLLNIWRIPFLFFVSGMGVYFAMQSRSWGGLLKERAKRILLPFVFGMFAIVPIHILIWRQYYGMELRYNWDPGHLWFLGNIFCYVLLLSPLFYLIKKNEEAKLVVWLKSTLRKPWGLLLALIPFLLEAVLINPVPFELYAMTWHGFVLGLIAFFFGFCFVLSGEGFWKMIQKWRWLFLVLGSGLFVFRNYYFKSFPPSYLLAIESFSWILTVFAFGSLYLKGPSKSLSYLSQAAYPVYILHMIFLYLGSLLIFPLEIPVYLQFLLVALITFAGCFGSYELIRRIPLLRPFFGLKGGAGK
ncbi:acyltransferase family protein [Algoriphagus pacificus]|uniref:Acyltransferase family protein n=1 Tax=Algoriphagus pacificus TaxID=2811234 RepID=A0ABS3CGR1_9BACT|nr:acyltransferase family protein [Algoriphagus pacificus]MBN7816292.1 acyltransferase family protein [Algoriphagus pacificus]